MINEKENTRISKFLSLVLRHQPQLINITLDQNGWADVSHLLTGMKKKGFAIRFEELEQVVTTNNKKRFAFNAAKTKIRASQGHSIEVDLDYAAKQPPAALYHGSAAKNTEAILQEGLDKRSRQHVHLSSTTETARQVGQRHGKPVVFEVAALKMHEDGYVFFISENNVWLTTAVPAHYLKLLNL